MYEWMSLFTTSSSIYHLWPLMIVIFDRYEGYVIMASICVSLMSGDVDFHLSMCLLAICIISFEKYLFRSSAHFLIKLLLFFFWCWVVWTVSFLGVPFYQLHCLQIFSHSTGCLFHFVNGFLCYAKKYLTLIRPFVTIWSMDWRILQCVK